MTREYEDLFGATKVHDLGVRHGKRCGQVDNSLTEYELMSNQWVVCFGCIDDELVAQRKVVVQRTHDSAACVVQLLEERLDVRDELIAERDVLGSGERIDGTPIEGQRR